MQKSTILLFLSLKIGLFCLTLQWVRPILGIFPFVVGIWIFASLRIIPTFAKE